MEMRYLIKRIGFETRDEEEAIAKVVEVYLDYYELDGRSKRRAELAFWEMFENEKNLLGRFESGM